jgi:8-oxo-dGTP pyrophosphatase MutT (NUDIX family)
MATLERSAGFVIYRQKRDGRRVYLVLDYGKHWDFPKGHLKRGETDMQAAVRELEEETGLDEPRPVEGFQFRLRYFFRHKKKGLVDKTVVFFIARVKTSRIQLSDEHVGYKYLSASAAKKRLTYASARHLLDLADEFLNGADDQTPAATGADGVRS